MSDVCRALGIVPRGGNYETVWRRIRTLELDACHLELRQVATIADPLSIDLEVTDALVIAVASARSIRATCRALGLDPQRYQKRVGRAIRRRGIDTSHFIGQGWARGRTDLPARGRPLSELLTLEAHVNTRELKRRLIEEKVREHRCEGCGLDEWRAGPIPLELDHVNGDRSDNRLENLRLLCPNCHALTPTYRGRNIGRRGGMQTRPA